MKLRIILAYLLTLMLFLTSIPIPNAQAADGPPTLTAVSVSNISERSATFSATINTYGAGGATIKEYGFCWDKNANPTTKVKKGDKIDKSKQFSDSATKLEPGTKYYVRAYAINTKGYTGYSPGPGVTFTTNNLVAPTITEPGKQVEAGSIKVKWTSVKGAEEFKINVRDITNSETGPIVLNAQIVPSSRTYSDSFTVAAGHKYRAWVGALVNKTVYSQDQIEFVVKPKDVPVTAVKLNKTTLNLEGGKSATLIATVEPSNATNKNVKFSSDQKAVATVDEKSGLVTAISPGTAKITVQSVSDTSKYAQCAVTVINRPTLSTEDISPTSTSVTLAGMITLDGGENSTYYGFKYGTDPDPANDTNAKKADFSEKILKEVRFTKTITLSPGTYYYCSFAMNSAGAGYGPAKRFTVPEPANLIPSIKEIIISPSAGKAGGSFDFTVKVDKELSDLWLEFKTPQGEWTGTSYKAKFSFDISKKVHNSDSTISYTFNTIINEAGPAGEQYKREFKVHAQNSTGEASKTGSFTVKPADIPVSGLKLNKNSLNLEAGKSETLIATIEPSNASNKEAKFVSNNDSIATVGETSGIVTAISAGSTTITAMSASDTSKCAQCTVTVTKTGTETIAVYVNGVPVNFQVQPISEKGVTLVELRALFDALDANISYDSNTQKVTGTRNGKTVEFIMGQTTAYQNGIKETLTVTPRTINGRSMGPVRFVCQAFGATIVPVNDYRIDITIAKSILVERIALEQHSLKMEKSQKQKMTARVEPSNATEKGIIWSSNATSIVSIDKNSGELTAMAEGTATIKATSIADSSKYDTCVIEVGSVVIPEKPEITSPSAAVLPAGDVNVAWKTVNATRDYELYLRDISPGVNLEVQNYYPRYIQDGSSNCTIPAQVFQKGHKYRVAIAAVFENGQKAWGQKEFSIESELVEQKDGPVIDIQLTPQADSYLQGQKINIRGTASDADGINAIALYIDPVQNQKPLIRPEGVGALEYEWDTSGVSPGRHQIKVSAMDNTRLSNAKTVEIDIIKNSGPELSASIVAPSSGSPYVLGSILEINAQVRSGDCSKIQVDITPTPQSMEQPTYIENSSFLNFSWNTVNENPGDYTIKITATDSTGKQTLLNLKAILVREMLFTGQPTCEPVNPGRNKEGERFKVTVKTRSKDQLYVWFRNPAGDWPAFTKVKSNDKFKFTESPVEESMTDGSTSYIYSLELPISMGGERWFKIAAAGPNENTPHAQSPEGSIIIGQSIALTGLTETGYAGDPFHFEARVNTKPEYLLVLFKNLNGTWMNPAEIINKIESRQRFSMDYSKDSSNNQSMLVYKKDISIMQPGQRHFKIVATDNQGHILYQSNKEYQIDVKKPAIKIEGLPIDKNVVGDLNLDIKCDGKAMNYFELMLDSNNNQIGVIIGENKKCTLESTKYGNDQHSLLIKGYSAELSNLKQVLSKPREPLASVEVLITINNPMQILTISPSKAIAMYSEAQTITISGSGFVDNKSGTQVNQVIFNTEGDAADLQELKVYPNKIEGKLPPNISSGSYIVEAIKGQVKCYSNWYRIDGENVLPEPEPGESGWLPAQSIKMDINARENSPEGFLARRIKEINGQTITRGQFYARNLQIQKDKQQKPQIKEYRYKGDPDNKDVQEMANKLSWNQDKVDRLWKEALQAEIDPRLLLAIIIQEGTGSFNTCSNPPVYKGVYTTQDESKFGPNTFVSYVLNGNGPHPDFAADTANAIKIVLGNLRAYSYYGEEFEQTLKKNSIGNGGLFAFINYKTPRVVYKNSSYISELEPGYYAGDYTWWKGVKNNYNKLVGINDAADQYSQYWKTKRLQPLKEGGEYKYKVEINKEGKKRLTACEKPVEVPENDKDTVIEAKYYSQLDRQWAKKQYYAPGKTIGGTGCGPTCAAMVLTTLTGEEHNPIEMAKFAVEKKAYVKEQGTDGPKLFSKLANTYNIESKMTEKPSIKAIAEALRAGKIVVAGMGPGHFTEGGHFIVLRGITADGSKIWVYDPNHKNANNKWNANKDGKYQAPLNVIAKEVNRIYVCNNKVSRQSLQYPEELLWNEPDTTPPEIIDTYVSEDNQSIIIVFTEEIEPVADTNIYDGIKYSVNGGEYLPLTDLDEVEIYNNLLIIRLNAGIIGGDNKVELKAGTVVDYYGNMLNSPFISDSMEADTTAPVLENILVHGDNKNICLQFNENIYINVEDLNSSIQLSLDGIDYRPLSQQDEVNIVENCLYITLAFELSGQTNRIKINPQTLKDFAGNIVDYEIVSNLLGADIQPPAYKSISLSEDHKTLMIQFDENIYGNLMLLKKAISISANGQDYAPLGDDAQISLERQMLVIRFNEPYQADEILVKITSGIIKDIAGNIIYEDVNAEPVIIPANTPPEFVKANINSAGNLVSIYFDKTIKQKADFREAVFFTLDGVNFQGLGDKDNVTEHENMLLISFDLPLTGSKNKIRIEANTIADIFGNVLATPIETEELAVDTAPPVLQGSAVMAGGSRVVLHFDKYLTSNIPDISAGLFLARDGSNYLALSTDDTITINQNCLEIELLVPLDGQDNRIKIAANSLKDSVGNVQTEDLFTDKLATDAAGPIIDRVLVSPDCREVKLLFDEGIMANVEDLKAAIEIALDDNDFTSLNPEDNVTIAGNVLVIRLNSPPVAGCVRVRLAAASLKDTSGNITLDTLVSQPVFAGEALLLITSTNPADGASAVDINRDIILTFNDIVQPDFAYDDISLIDGSGSSVEITKFIDNNILIIQPINRLNYGEAYTVAIPAEALQNQAGKRISGTRTLTFTTDSYLRGDLTEDSRVDKLDLITMIPNYGKRARGSNRQDLNGDGIIDLYDLVLLSRSFGNTIPVSRLSIYPKTLELNLDSYPAFLEVRIEPANASNKDLIWLSSDTSVAMVKEGVIIPVGEGHATISATSVDGWYYASCEVTVLPGEQ